MKARKIIVAIATAAAMGVVTTAQTHRPLSREAVLLAVDRLLADRWYPDDGRPKPALTQDQEILQQALMSSVAAIRRLGVRSLGRFEDPLEVPTISAFLQDSDADVHCEAINAMVMALHKSEGADVLPGMRALLTPYQPATPQPRPPVCAMDPREAVARLHYDRDTSIAVLRALTANPTVSGNLNPVRENGVRPSVSFDRPEATLVLRLILIMLQRDRTLPIDSDLRFWVRFRANPPMNAPMPAPGMVGRPDLDALEILGLLQETDPVVFAHAALWTCAGTAASDPYCGWQIRLAGVRGLSPLDPVAAQALDQARRDAAPEVRVMAIRRYASVITKTGTCEPLASAVWDEAESLLVRIEAADLLSAKCQEREDVARRLSTVAAQLGDATKLDEWRLSSHALETLANFDAAEATRIVDEMALKHPVWLVRAAAARAAVTVKDEGALLKLARDADTNVRNEALNGLVTLQSPAAIDLALEGLKSADDQLVMTAARILKGAEDRDTAIQACFKALMRITVDGRDTSSLVRLSLLERLKEWAPQDATGASPIGAIVGGLAELLRDFDPFVAAKAATVIGLATGQPVRTYPTRRPLQQLTEQELKVESLPVCAKFLLADGGAVVITFTTGEAPVAVARFARLAGSGYFSDQPFVYRRRTLETLDAGSPRGNDMSGDAVFTRDEIGVERHTLGTVGLSTYSRDTGDMRFFVDLWQQPRSDFEFTVLGTMAYRPEGPQLVPAASVNGILEGGTISNVFLGFRGNTCQ